MNEHEPQENPFGPSIRSFEYDVLIKNLREQYPELYEQLLLAAEAESATMHDKQQFIHGFLYNFGIISEKERTALLERIFSMPSVTEPIDGGDDEVPLRSGEPGGDQPVA